MNIYRATIIATGKTYDYAHDFPLDFDGMNPASQHILIGTPPVAELPKMFGGRRRISKLEFTKIFTDTEFTTILAGALQSQAVNVWWQKFVITTPDIDGSSIDLDNTETICGVRALENGSLIGAGRAREILNG